MAPYCDQPDRWGELDYVLLANGQKTRLSSVDTDDEGSESFVIDDAPHKLRKVVECFSESIEHKSLAPDGSKCTATTKGLLRRRPIRASGVFHFIGKEVDRGTSTDPEYFPDDQKIMRYGTSGRRFPEALRKFSVRELMERTGLSSETIQRAKSGKRIHPKTARKLHRRRVSPNYRIRRSEDLGIGAKALAISHWLIASRSASWSFAIAQ